MLYDRDVWEVKVKEGKVFIEYNVPVEEAIFTRDDLTFLMQKLDSVTSVCKHYRMQSSVVKELDGQVVWVHADCPDCGHGERTLVKTPYDN